MLAYIIALLFPLLLVPVNIVGSASTTVERIVLDNGYFIVTVDTYSSDMGSFTIATGDQHPNGRQDVFYDGEDMYPGTSFFAVTLPQFNTSYGTEPSLYAPEGYSYTCLCELDHTISNTSNTVSITWDLGNGVKLVSEVILYGNSLNNSFVEHRLRIINNNGFDLEVWIKDMWDIMIDGEDGSVIRFWNENGPVTGWLTNETYITDFSNIKFWQTTNDNENPLFYIWGSISLPQGATTPTAFIYADWSKANDDAWNVSVDPGYYIKGDDTSVAYLWMDHVPAHSEKVYRQFILAVSNMGEQPPEVVTTTVPGTGETTTTPPQQCSPETVTVTDTVTETYTTTDTITVTQHHTKIIGGNNTIEILGKPIGVELVLIAFGAAALFFILFIIMLILYVTKK